MRGRKRPVFLVLDGHPSHRAKMISTYVKELKGRLELHFLPGYAPELNPAEFVWNYVKNEGVSKKPLKRNESLRRRVDADLANIKRCLKPGGMLILQGYTPRQLEYRTGGPSQIENLYTETMLREAFFDMEILYLHEHDDIINEGAGHSGMSALIDLVARKP